MGRDRLAEFRQKANVSEGDPENGHSNTVGVGETGENETQANNDIHIDMEMDSSLKSFLTQVKETKNMIHIVKADVVKVKALHQHVMSVPNPDEKMTSELYDLMATIKANSQVIRRILKGMTKENAESENEGNSASARMKATQYSALLRNFNEVTHEYQHAQTEYRDACKNRLKRQLEITNAKCSEEDIDEMIDKGNFSIFTQGLLLQTEEAKQVLADAQARHNDIIKLEQSLIELHELFKELAVLVESQGPLIDNIADQVHKTEHFVAAAKVELKEGHNFQKKARKKKVYLILILTITVIVVGTIVGIVLCFV